MIFFILWFLRIDSACSQYFNTTVYDNNGYIDFCLDKGECAHSLIYNYGTESSRASGSRSLQNCKNIYISTDGGVIVSNGYLGCSWTERIQANTQIIRCYAEGGCYYTNEFSFASRIFCDGLRSCEHCQCLI